MRLAPFLVLAAVIACGSPAVPTSGATHAPAATAAGDVEEISLEISALM